MTMKNLSTYGHHFKIKCIFALLNDKHFLHNISDVLLSDYFESPAHKWIIDTILEYYSKYHTTPTMEVLKMEMKKETNDVLQLSIKEELKQAYTVTDDDIEYVKEEFFNFCKNQRLKEALLKSVDLLEAGEYEDIRKLVDEALKAGVEKNTGHEYEKDIESRFREEEVKKVPFPWKVFNDVTDGGVGGGDLMLLFAPPGIGKSTVVANIAAHVAKVGMNVVFYTLELKDSYIGKKIDSILTGIEVKQLRTHRREVELAIEDLKGRIIIKEYSPKKASLDTIESHIRQLETNNDFIPDMVIIDYPDLLKVRKNRRELKEEIDDIYTDLKGLAKDMNIPFVCPSQINRMGAKDDVIEGDKVAGSFAKMMIADLSISLSRKRKDKLNGTGRFHFMKSRLGPDGMTYNAKIDLNKNYIDVTGEEFDESESTDDSGINDNDLKIIRKKFITLND